MSRPSFKFTHDGNTVALEADVSGAGTGRVFHFKFETSAEWVAILLREHLAKEMWDLLAAERKRYYDLGWKAAKGKKLPKRMWFPGVCAETET